ncbi:hypothetical protein [Robinsoniella sp. KNHs210]|uniref:hypothetical protein n=1 Tax=Robinsoniella sp. KNHs210 TaxID=1469950 RepID=UPI0004815B53|nr:hypothetical protein [Robinsoniella sp. KNHs210]
MEGFIGDIRVEGYETFVADFESVSEEDGRSSAAGLLESALSYCVIGEAFGLVNIEWQAEFTKNHKAVTFFIEVSEVDDGIRLKYVGME